MTKKARSTRSSVIIFQKKSRRGTMILVMHEKLRSEGPPALPVPVPAVLPALPGPVPVASPQPDDLI